MHCNYNRKLNYIFVVVHKFKMFGIFRKRQIVILKHLVNSYSIFLQYLTTIKTSTRVLFLLIFTRLLIHIR